MLKRTLALIIAAGPAALAQSAQSAQAGPRCSEAPGALFGVGGFSCSNCSFELKDGRTTYTFTSEPVVTSAQQGGSVVNGDVIVAVDGLPITTQAGAERFANPAVGTHVLTVRRGRDRQDVRMELTSTCPHTWSSSFSYSSRGSDGIRAGSGSGAGSRSSSGKGSGMGRGEPVIGGDPLVVINGGGKIETGNNAIGRFGFGVECRNSCSARRMPNGTYVYSYDDYPVIAAVRAGSIAERTGLRVGDEIISINGKSILADDALMGSDGSDTLKMVVRRDGKDINVLLLVTH